MEGKENGFTDHVNKVLRNQHGLSSASNQSGFYGRSKEPGKSKHLDAKKIQALVDEMAQALPLAGKASNISVYRPLHVLKAKRTYAQYVARSLIDNELKILKVYDKRELIKQGKVDALFRELKNFKALYPEKTSVYQDFRFLFLVQNYRAFTNLQEFLAAKRPLNELALKFLAFEIFSQLEKLHERGYVHLNLCPKNIGIDEVGDIYFKGLQFVCDVEEDPEQATYVHLITRKNNWEFLAPELLLAEEIDYSCDYYAVGMLLYRILIKDSNLSKCETLQQYEKTLEQKQVQVKKERIPEGWSLECADFINKLTQRQKMHRLGAFSVEEIYSHLWLEVYKSKYETEKANQMTFLKLAYEADKDKAAEFENTVFGGNSKSSAFNAEKVSLSALFKDCLTEPDAQVELAFEMFFTITDA